MKGRITTWKEDKGFGFILGSESDKEIFFHISVVRKAVRQPKVGDQVEVSTALDGQGRVKATHVVLMDVSPAAQADKPQRIVTEPVRRDALDYFLYAALALLLAAAALAFLKTGTPESAAIPGALFAAGLLFLLSRQKRPANKMFSCAKCRAVADHDARTIQAWNRGMHRLYCRPCHQKWLEDRPRAGLENQPGTRTVSSGTSGCLGLFIMFACLPALTVAVAIEWLV